MSEPIMHGSSDDWNKMNPQFRTRLLSELTRLKAENARLRKAGDAMASSIQFNEEMAQDYNGPTIVHQCVQRWNAAKEGKQS